MPNLRAVIIAAVAESLCAGLSTDASIDTIRRRVAESFPLANVDDILGQICLPLTADDFATIRRTGRLRQTALGREV